MNPQEISTSLLIATAALLSDCNEITQMTKFQCKPTHAFKAYLYQHKVIVNQCESGTS